MRQPALVGVVADEYVAVTQPVRTMEPKDAFDRMLLTGAWKNIGGAVISPPARSRITQLKSRDSRTIVE